MVECAGLEIRCTVMPYRGFESHLLRQELILHRACRPIAEKTPLWTPLCRPNPGVHSPPSGRAARYFTSATCARRGTRVATGQPGSLRIEPEAVFRLRRAHADKIVKARLRVFGSGFPGLDFHDHVLVSRER